MTASSPLPTLPAALAILEGTPGTLRALVAGVPAAMLLRTAEGEWCARDVLAHLWVNEGVAIERFRRMVMEDDPAIENMDEEAVLVASGARERDVARQLDDFARERGIAVAYLRGLTAGQLERAGMHSVAGPLRVVELLHHLAYHDLNHVRQIAALLAEPLDAPRGPLRVF